VPLHVRLTLSTRDHSLWQFTQTWSNAQLEESAH
jgi:hypothetical protein